jgi:hypothetical protein
MNRDRTEVGQVAAETKAILGSGDSDRSVGEVGTHITLFQQFRPTFTRGKSTCFRHLGYRPAEALKSSGDFTREPEPKCGMPRCR